MPAYNKFNQFVQDLADKALGLFGSPPADSLKLGLTNTSPNAADTHIDTVLSPDVIESTSNAAEITAQFGYTEGGTALTNPAGTRSGGTVTLAADQVVFTAAGGSFGPFQYYYLYDNTGGAAATRPIIAWWNHGSAVTLGDGESFTVKFNNQASAGTIFTLA